jgi:two-component system response regulator AtoC/two-component system nitrogen regulation response regulator NtrX
MDKFRILIVDDEATARYGIKKALGKYGYLIDEAENGGIALEKIKSAGADVVLCDINMPKMSGLDVLKSVKKLDLPEDRLPVFIVITAYGSEKLAVEAMKAGAYDYITKPYDIDELRLIIKNALHKKRLEIENVILRDRLETLSPSTVVGESDKIRGIMDMVNKVAPTDVTVLLTGESGTGKELIARNIHTSSPRSSGPFITMNCAAIPRDLVESELFGHEKGAFTGATNQRQGKFEIADSGTLFLDEIADMSVETQAKILRVLEEKSFTRLGGKSVIHTDVRLISATNKDLQQEIAAGRFRQDLYYRLKVLEIHLPRLTDRRTDIPLLADYFIGLFARKHDKRTRSIHPQALQVLVDYPWPGNIRELMHVIEHSIVLSEGEELLSQHLPVELIKSTEPAGDSARWSGLSFRRAKERAIRQVELEIITAALKESAGNISGAARSLDMKRQFLQQKIKALGIDVGEYKSGGVK